MTVQAEHAEVTGAGAPVAEAPGAGTPGAEEAERLRRWRLVLGGGAADGTGCVLGAADSGMDRTLEAVYGGG
ncbi:hypothetical protein ITI46_26655, partial [Streptomyces oryzae]|nr:hypothetical protein [Streptomyces oryzae]